MAHSNNRGDTVRRIALTLGATLIAIASAVFSTVSQAAQQMNDDELSQVYGHGASNISTAEPQTPQIPFLNPFTQFLDPKLATISTIGAVQFASDLAAIGAQPFEAPFYTGQDVIKMAFSAPAFNATMDLAQLIVPIPGATAGASLGTIQINQMNVTGTTVWIWAHH